MKSTALASLLVAASALADIGPPEPEAPPAAHAPAPPQPSEPPAPTAAAAAPTPAPDAPAAPQHPVGIEKAMASGVIQGGWEYVYASYGLGVFGVLAFAASLFLRRPKPQPGSPP
ncbi:MAG: hypothetical protein JNJ54_12860 [Myxococcaceae bacterium]|nr:hypothetical protein [Myxococcaceae bacterium]